MQFCVSNTDLEIIHQIKNESHTEFCTKQRLWEWWKVDKLSITWLLHSAVFCWIKTSTFRAYFLNRFSWICDHCNIFHLCDFSDSNTNSHSEATDPPLFASTRGHCHTTWIADALWGFKSPAPLLFLIIPFKCWSRMPLQPSRTGKSKKASGQSGLQKDTNRE